MVGKRVRIKSFDDPWWVGRVGRVIEVGTRLLKVEFPEGDWRKFFLWEVEVEGLE